ncbi:MAG TPA: hypothetical protein P5107_08725 [Thermotogota bacterium]|nr:hypothetical protein [Thermotogota bacterium]HRW35125.1 hypothetical protein [Thermotogota bacterium]
MFRRIGDFLKDITETLKRERGKLKINTDPVDFSVRIGSLLSADQQINIQDNVMFQDMFLPISMEKDSQKVSILGQSDHSPAPHIYSTTTAFRVELKRLVETESDLSIRDDSCVFGEKTTLHGINLEDYHEKGVVHDDFTLNQLNQIKINKEAFTEDMQRFSFRLESSDMMISTTLSSLETDFDRLQSFAFHFENSMIFNTSVDAYSLLFHINCQNNRSCIMKFPIKRNRVSKSGYETEELKRALEFIINRYEYRGKLSIVGIYKNVPIDTVERMTFSRGQELFFYLKKEKIKRQILMDVLIVRTDEGRYHVGPIIRKA